MTEASTSERLGYSKDARVLIVNADDFGMCHDANQATIEGLTHGLFTSSSILVTCPWFEEAADFARSHPDADLGVHLTLNSEWSRYKWGPVLGARAVPSLIDEGGYLWPDVPKVFERDHLDEAERELRAQIEKALLAGIDVTHLDSHMGPLHFRADYHELYLRLARDYRLPIRLAGRSRLETMGFHSIVEQIERDGIVHPDHLFFEGPSSPEDTSKYWTSLIRSLRPGATEILCHPAYAREELRACAHDPEQREADFRFFTSDGARRLVGDEGIELIGYRPLRDLMRGASSNPSPVKSRERVPGAQSASGR
ncbi:MAG TPA: polysaccharide deacetylase family protein [Candidatus Binataceae bacterium]|nr:polysaccharide deacetylase family protein [Candidatus Binataceae bacterium]